MPIVRSLGSCARVALTAVAFCSHPKFLSTRAEEQSILIGATTEESLYHPSQNNSKTALIDGGFMSMAVSKF